MTRLKYLRTHIEYPEDIKKIILEVPELHSYAEAQQYWRDFSEDIYCASWIITDEHYLKEFRKWLMEDINEFILSQE